MTEYQPTLNAILNAVSSLLMILGIGAIRKKEKEKHQRYLLGAVGTSSLFLISYIIYHINTATLTRFAETGWIKTVYLIILTSHSILAVLVIPLVTITVIRGLKGDFERHKKLARWTFPIWLYVSVTGVVVYIMLYHF